MSAYDFKVKDGSGQEVPLKDYEGKVLLVVNVASKCGFTPQYAGLEALYRKHKDKGLVILGFPCNQFGNQEPGNADDIKSFCSLNYGVTFPVMAKIEVNGDSADPFYKFLKKEKPGLLGSQAIKWNFTKFLLNRSGEVVQRFAPNSKPADLEKDIEKLL